MPTRRPFDALWFLSPVPRLPPLACMIAYLAVASPQSSEPVSGPAGSPIDLTRYALPSSPSDAKASRLLSAVARAAREMSIRQPSSAAGSELRLAIITTTDAGTDMEATVGELDLQSVDFDAPSDRADVLDRIRRLERRVLSGS